MAYTSINKFSENFITKLYTGTDNSNAVTVGFRPDLVWIKKRAVASHALQDSLTGNDKTFRTNQSSARYTNNFFSSFDTNGFTVDTSESDVNASGASYASWNWKANGGTGVSNTDGTITATVSANQTAGFSIVRWNGTSATGTIGHGLGVAPDTIWVKSDSNAEGMYTYWKVLGNNKQLLFSSNSAEGTTSLWNSTDPTSSVFSVTNHSAVNGSGYYTAYCFANKTGYQKVGLYEGVGASDNMFVYTGFSPRFLLTKPKGQADSWFINDTARATYNPSQKYLRPNENSGEGDSASHQVDLLSNGFKIRSTDTALGSSGQGYVYVAIGQSLVGSNNVPCLAR